MNFSKNFSVYEISSKLVTITIETCLSAQNRFFFNWKKSPLTRGVDEKSRNQGFLAF